MIVLAALTSITIVAGAEGLTAPAQTAAGLTTITFENKTAEPHAIRLVRLAAPHTVDDLAAFLKTGGAPPAWLQTAGGIAPLAPGLSEEFSAMLTAGSYAVVDGERFAPLRVENAPTTLPAIKGDIEVRVFDHGFQFGAPIEGPRPMWHLRNAGTEPHQALLVRLTEGMTEFAVRNWITNGMRGPAPGDPRGGVLELPINGEAWFRVDLPAGRYVLLCGELEQEGRHFDLGMIYRFTIE